MVGGSYSLTSQVQRYVEILFESFNGPIFGVLEFMDWCVKRALPIIACTWYFILYYLPLQLSYSICVFGSSKYITLCEFFLMTQ